MCAELKDCRAKITVQTDCALEAESQVTGKERQEIVREILHDWAIKRIQVATVLNRELRSEGLPGIGEGIRGNQRESQGIAGQGMQAVAGNAKN